MIMGHVKILEYALSCCWRRKYKNFAIVAVYSFTISILASILFLTNSLKTEVSAVLTHAPQLTVQALSGGRHELISIEYGSIIRKIPGVGEVKPRFWGYYYDSLTKSNYTMIGVTKDSSDLQLLEGELPVDPGQCAIGSGVAGIRHLAVGEDLVLIDSSNMGVVLEVTGIFAADSALVANDLVVLPEQELVRFFNLPVNRATDLMVQVYNEKEVNNIARKIKEALPDTRPITRAEIIRTYDAVFNWRSGMMLTIFSSALIAFCILAWDKATGISADEKREIGILKAIGWETTNILELKFWEGMVVSLTSFLIGMIAAFIHVYFFDAPFLVPVLKGWSVLFPPFKLTPNLGLYEVFTIGFLTVTPYVASTVIPSWKNAITDPEDVMRS